MTHDQIDARSLEMALCIAELIDADPTLLERARRKIEHWDTLDCNCIAWDRWRAIFKGSWPEIRAALVAETEDSTLLRSSSPFTGILSQEKRAEIFSRYPRQL